MNATTIAYPAQCLAAALAWALRGRIGRQYRPVAALLTLGVVSDGVTWILLATAPGQFVSDGPPLMGWLRAAWSLGMALTVGWDAALAGACLPIFFRRRAWPVLVVYLGAVLALAVRYPRGHDLAVAYRTAHVAAVAVGVLGLVLGRWRRTDVEHLALAAVVGAEAVSILGPWFAPFSLWEMARWGYAVLFLVLILFQGGVLWAISYTSKSSSVVSSSRSSAP